MLALRDAICFDTSSFVPAIEWTLADVVRKLCEMRGWKWKDLSRASGIDPTVISRFAKGGSSDPKTIDRIAETLEVKLSDLHAYREPVSLTREHCEWIKLLSDLDARRREEHLMLARRALQAQTLEQDHEQQTKPSASPSKAKTG